jgi:pyocin large subunit-like protein
MFRIGRSINLLLLLLCSCGPQARHGAAAERVATKAPVVHSTTGFRSEALWDEHYRKHGREFGGVTKREYLRLAQELRDRPAGGPVLESRRADGVITRYDRDGGAFLAFDPDGTIRTFFRPNQGETYFWRQARR